jgi:hypothetical protein
MKALVNDPPTPPGFGYQLRNPWAGGKIVNYDDCERDSGTMDEFKGPGYTRQLRYQSNRDSITYRWLDQATRQVEASGGRPVKWYFAEREALEFAQGLFHGDRHKYLNGIELSLRPFGVDDRYKPLTGDDQ